MITEDAEYQEVKKDMDKYAVYFKEKRALSRTPISKENEEERKRKAKELVERMK